MYDVIGVTAAVGASVGVALLGRLVFDREWGSPHRFELARLLAFVVISGSALAAGIWLGKVPLAFAGGALFVVVMFSPGLTGFDQSGHDN